MAGKNVFICAAAEDANYYIELIAALDAWEAPHTELGVVPGPVTSMPPFIEEAIRDCEVFLRLCTAHTRQSSAVNLATNYFLRLLQEDRQKGARQRRKLVNLILDPSYPLDGEEKKTLFITTAGKSRALWLEELAAPVGVATLAQRVSRRALLGMGVGAVVTLASVGVAGKLLYQQHQPPPEAALPNQAKLSGNPRFLFDLDTTKETAGHALLFQDGATIYAQPSLSDNSFTEADSSVYVLSPTTRKQRRIPVKTDIATQGILLSAAQGLFTFFFEGDLNATVSPTFRAMRASDGEQLWQVNCTTANPPAIADGVVYVVLDELIGTEEGGNILVFSSFLFALRAQDGTVIWRVRNYDFRGLTPAVSGGRLYIGSATNAVNCLDAKTGKTLWQYQTNGPVQSTPLIANGVVYAGSDDGMIYALDATTGKLRWRFATSAGVTASPLLRDGVLYTGSGDAYIYALEASSGGMHWRAYVGADPLKDDIQVYGIETTPAIYRNVLFATTNGGLYAFDTRTGVARWRYIPVAENPGTLSSPIISNGLALVGAANNHVYAVNP